MEDRVKPLGGSCSFMEVMMADGAPSLGATPIVFFPGASGSSAVWRPVARSLGSRVRLLIDYPGLGAPLDPRIGCLSDLFQAILEKAPVVFDAVALSMGCVLALRAAIECPHRVRRLVLVAPTGGCPVGPLGAQDWRSAWVRARPHAPTWFVDDNSDFTQQLPSLRAPTRILFGDCDPLSSEGVANFLSAHIPLADVRCVRRGTHSLTDDHASAVAQFVREHLDAVEPLQ